jgi:hypothetical protein
MKAVALAVAWVFDIGSAKLVKLFLLRPAGFNLSLLTEPHDSLQSAQDVRWIDAGRIGSVVSRHYRFLISAIGAGDLLGPPSWPLPTRLSPLLLALIGR